MHNQKGQTIIETVIGIVILIMGITASVGLATFALNSTSNVTKQLVATGLAREGVEALRNMRDTNWLQSADLRANCYNFQVPSANNAACYGDWMTAFYDLNPSGGNCCVLDISTTATDEKNYWQLGNSSGPASQRYLLYFDATAASGLLYTPQSGGGRVATEYRRKIVVTPYSTGPYYDKSGVGPRLQITSTVWWEGKGCASSDDVPLDKKCAVELVTYLTNWRNY